MHDLGYDKDMRDRLNRLFIHTPATPPSRPSPPRLATPSCAAMCKQEHKEPCKKKHTPVLESSLTQR